MQTVDVPAAIEAPAPAWHREACWIARGGSEACAWVGQLTERQAAAVARQAARSGPQPQWYAVDRFDWLDDGTVVGDRVQFGFVVDHYAGAIVEPGAPGFDGRGVLSPAAADVWNGAAPVGPEPGFDQPPRRVAP